MRFGIVFSAFFLQGCLMGGLRGDSWGYDPIDSMDKLASPETGGVSEPPEPAYEPSWGVEFDSFEATENELGTSEPGAFIVDFDGEVLLVEHHGVAATCEELWEEKNISYSDYTFWINYAEAEATEGNECIFNLIYTVDLSDLIVTGELVLGETYTVVAGESEATFVAEGY